MSEPTFLKKSLTLEKAQEMVNAAVKKAAEMGLKQVVAVCDESGILKAFARMDGAPLQSIQVAQDKAYTSVSFGVPTSQWYGALKEEPALLVGAPSGIKRMIIFAGGVPVKDGEQVVGGIGVSGASAEQDDLVARAGLAVFNA